MKFFPLIETAANSGQFQLSGAAVEADNTTAALALIEPTVGAGLRYGAWLYHEVRGLPDFAPVTDAEKANPMLFWRKLAAQISPGRQMGSSLSLRCAMPLTCACLWRSIWVFASA